MPIEVIKHEAVPKCGSYEVRYSDGQPSRYFYFEDLPSRRLRPLEQLTGEEAERRYRSFTAEPDAKSALTRKPT